MQQDQQGVLGQAVNLTFGIVDAPDAKTVLRSTACMLALIASDEFYRTVIVQDPAADPGAYRQISIPVKETSVLAWLRIPAHRRKLRDALGEIHTAGADVKLS